ncbi:MAG: molybdenum cofactor biosynthesis protein MoaE [Thermodesulfobacteriota bacterium]
MSTQKVSLEEMIRRVKSRPDSHRAGMILCHNGIVRSSDRAGEKAVVKLQVRTHGEKLEEIRAWGEQQPGIVAVLIEAREGELKVGDDLLFIVVAGDIREHVFPVMREILERIKAQGVTKTEVYGA